MLKKMADVRLSKLLTGLDQYMNNSLMDLIFFIGFCLLAGVIGLIVFASIKIGCSV